MPEGTVTSPPKSSDRPKPPTIPRKPPAVPVGMPVPINRQRNAGPKNMADSLKKEVDATLNKQTFVIRTMQDDMRAARGEPSLPLTKVNILTPDTKTISADKKIMPQATMETNAPMPLPPINKTQKVVILPLKARRRRSRALPWLLIFLWLVLAGGGGVAWWFYDLSTNQQTPAPAIQVLPANSAAIVQYNFSSAEERSELMSAWNTAGNGPASMASMLSGDPRLLITESDIATFYYVLLENEVRPYVVVPISDRSQELFTNNPDVRVEELSGWYILNSNSTASFQTARQAGTLAQIDRKILPETGGPVRVFLGPNAFNTTREALLGSELVNGLLQEASLTGQAQAGQSAMAFTGQASTIEPLLTASAAPADQQILSVVPEEAGLIRLGDNFSHDLKGWAPLSGALDLDILEQPTAAALVKQMTSSYAFFSLALSPATRDIGVIIVLPPALQAQLRAPDSDLESAMSSLLPLVTGRKGIAPIEFNDNTHAGVPLRYANFSQPSQALDYAIVDNYLVITTSRESMFIVLETLTGTHTAAAASNRWQGLLAAWGALPATPQLILGQMEAPQLAQLFPGATDVRPLFGLAAGPDKQTEEQTEAKNSVEVSGILMWPNPLK